MPSAARRKPEGIPVAGRDLPDAEQTGERIELVGQCDRDANRSVGKNVAGKGGVVVRFDRVGDRLRLAVVQRVVAPHRSLQLGKLADHLRQKIGFREPGGASRQKGIGVGLVGDLSGQQLDALDALELAAELAVMHDAGEARHARFQSRLAVLVVEKLRVREARPQHALVAVRDFPRLLRLEVGHEQEAGEELPGRLLAQRHVLLVALHREHEAFLRHVEELAPEFARVHGRPFDQRGDLVEESVVRNQRSTRAGGAFERLHDQRAPHGKTGDDLALLAQRALVIVGILEQDGAAGQEAVPVDLVGAFSPEHFARNDARTVQHHEPVHGAGELRLARAPPHDFRDRELIQGSFDLDRQRSVEVPPLGDVAVKKELALGGLSPDELADFDAVLLRESKQGLRRLPLGIERGLDAGA